MNYLLHCQRSPGAVVPIPEDLEQLMAQISREVLRAQPKDVNAFLADYLEEQLARRESRRLAEKVVDNVLDFSLDTVAMLEAVGIDRERGQAAMKQIRDEFHRHFETVPDDELQREEFRERDVLERLVKECRFSELEARKASAIIERAYRTYYFRNVYKRPHPPAKDKDWRQAARHALSIYAQTGPTREEMEVAAGRIQAAYRGYYTRKRDVMNRQATVIQRAFRSHQRRKEANGTAPSGDSGSAILTHEVLQADEPTPDRQSDTSFSPIEEILRLIRDTVGDGDGERAEGAEQTDHQAVAGMDVDEAATLIQSVFRGHRRRNQQPPTARPVIVDVPAVGPHEAATLIQPTFRAHSARQRVRQETTRHKMATLLQSHARGYLARKRHSRNRPARTASSAVASARPRNEDNPLGTTAKA